MSSPWPWVGKWAPPSPWLCLTLPASCHFLRLGSESYRGSIVLLLASLGQSKKQAGKWKRGKQVRLGKEPGDSGRASRGRMLGVLALILWVLHQFLSLGGLYPSQPTVASSRGVLPEEPGHGISGGRPGNQGQSHTRVMEGPSGVQFSWALKYSSHW